MEWTGVPPSESGSGHVHRCIRAGMGDSHEQQVTVEHMDTGGSAQPHQLEGTASDLALNPYAPNLGQDNPCDLQQHHDNCSDQQIRRHQITSAAQADSGHLGPVSSDGHVIDDNLHALTIQSSGCTIEAKEYAIRMVNSSVILSEVRQGMGATHHQFVCIDNQLQAPQVHLLDQGTPGMEAGCTQLLLEGPGTSLHLPPMVDPQQSNPEDQGGVDQSDIDHTMVERNGLVPNTGGNGSRGTKDGPAQVSTPCTRQQSKHSSEESNVATRSMAS